MSNQNLTVTVRRVSHEKSNVRPHSNGCVNTRAVTAAHRADVHRGWRTDGNVGWRHPAKDSTTRFSSQDASPWATIVCPLRHDAVHLAAVPERQLLLPPSPSAELLFPKGLRSSCSSRAAGRQQLLMLPWRLCSPCSLLPPCVRRNRWPRRSGAAGAAAAGAHR